MTKDWSLEEVNDIDLEWTNEFAARRGWKEYDLEDPEEALELFFSEMNGTKMLDSGSGWGRYVHRFLENFLDYVGLDYSEEMVRAAQEANPEASFTLGSFLEIPFPSDCFDGIWSCCAFSGLPKKYLLEALREHRRVLKTGGIMLCVMPSNGYSGEEMLTDLIGDPTLYQASYIPREISKYFVDAGFSVEKVVDRKWSMGAMHILARKE